MTNPMEPLDSARGFMKSRIILTCVELDLFTLIHRGVNTVDLIAEKVDINHRAVMRLLDAVTVYGYLKKEKNVYLLPTEMMCLSKDHPGSILPMLLHMNELWDSWSLLTDSVIQGSNPHRVPVREKDEKSLKAFIGAMHVIGESLSKEIAEYLDLSSYQKLLDIGGASGTYTISFLKQNQNMTAIIFDLERVIPMAKQRLEEADMLHRVDLASGDFYKDTLPGGCDLALLSAIIHQNSHAQNIDLYKKIYQALLPGGTLMIRDHVMDNDRINPAGGAIFALNMLVATETGDTYTFDEISESLSEAGFTNVQQERYGGKMDCIITARKP